MCRWKIIPYCMLENLSGIVVSLTKKQEKDTKQNNTMYGDGYANLVVCGDHVTCIHVQDFKLAFMFFNCTSIKLKLN